MLQHTFKGTEKQIVSVYFLFSLTCWKTGTLRGTLKDEDTSTGPTGKLSDECRVITLAAFLLLFTDSKSGDFN